MMATTHSLLGLLVILCGAVMAEDPVESYAPKGPSIEDVRYALYDLENYIAHDFALQSDAALLLSRGVETFNFIFDERVPSLQISNAEQARITGVLGGQIAGLEGFGNRLISSLSSTIFTALDVDNTVHLQNSFIDATVERNGNQDASIAALRQELTSQTVLLEAAVAEAVSGSGGDNSALFALLEDLNDFIDGRICEIGTASIPPGMFEVPFKIAFDEEPQVSLGLSGFGLRADRESYGSYDSLSLDKHLYNITRDSFFVSAVDVSDGMVEVETIYCVYMACQNLDRDYVKPVTSYS